MAVFIVLWPYLLTTKLKSVIHHNLGHFKTQQPVAGFGKTLPDLATTACVYYHYGLIRPFGAASNTVWPMQHP